jgi:hypothetical protein
MAASSATWYLDDTPDVLVGEPDDEHAGARSAYRLIGTHQVCPTTSTGPAARHIRAESSGQAGTGDKP